MVSRSLGHTADGKNNCRQPAKLVDVDQSVSMPTVLIVHAIVAPIAFALLSWHFFRGHVDAPPLRTSPVMVGLVIGLDGLVVAPFIEHSYAMFANPLGTWIPFASIWLASFLTGRVCREQRHAYLS
jgi:hypothetical protein